MLSAQVSQMSVAQLMEAFKLFKRAEGRMRRTLLDYDRVFADVLKAIGDISLSDLSLAMLRNYVHTLMERGWKTATVNVYVRVLRCWLHWLYQEGYLKENLAGQVKPLRAPRQYPYVLSDAQAVALIQAAKQQSGWIGVRDHAVMLTFLDAMLRLSELIALELADVSLQARSIRVRHGKGDKERMVFMGRRLSRSLRDWLQVRGHIVGEDRLFTSRTDGGLTKRGAHELVRRLGRAAKIDG